MKARAQLIALTLMIVAATCPRAALAGVLTTYPTTANTPTAAQLTPANIPKLTNAQIQALSPYTIEQMLPEPLLAFTDAQRNQFNTDQKDAYTMAYNSQGTQIYLCNQAKTTINKMFTNRAWQGLSLTFATLRTPISNLQNDIAAINCNCVAPAGVGTYGCAGSDAGVQQGPVAMS